MNRNDVLRRLRYALELSNTQMVNLFKLGKLEISHSELLALLAKEGSTEFVECTDQNLGGFLDGLVLERRGPRESGAAAPRADNSRLSNNSVLKKLRIALTLSEEDMLALLAAGGMTLSRSELRALFRAEKHKNYRPCGDQVLRNFLAGLTTKLRGTQESESEA